MITTLMTTIMTTTAAAGMISKCVGVGSAVAVAAERNTKQTTAIVNKQELTNHNKR